MKITNFSKFIKPPNPMRGPQKDEALRRFAQIAPPGTIIEVRGDGRNANFDLVTKKGHEFHQLMDILRAAIWCGSKDIVFDYRFRRLS